MTITVYLDLYFLVNSIMDYLLLTLVKKILKLPAKRLRMLAGALLGAVWACASLLFPLFSAWAELVFTWLLISALMILVAFGRRNISEFVKILCTLWLVSAASGGVLGALGDHLRGNEYLTGGIIPNRWSAVSLLCGMVGIYYGICACILFIRSRIQEQKNYYEVILSYQGKKKTVTALMDTGNQLYEPYGHQPVHVISYEACRQFCDSVSRIIYIPFQAVGTEYGMLPGIQVDEMEVVRDGKVVMVFKKPWLAVSKEPLCSDHQYEMLLHQEEQN